MLSKILVLKLKSMPNRLIVLEQLRMQFLGETAFVTGIRMTGLAHDEVWLKGVPVWYPLAEVLQMAEFESYEELKRAEIFQKMSLEAPATPVVPAAPASTDGGHFRDTRKP